MKCEKCGAEFSDRVCVIHRKVCEKNTPNIQKGLVMVKLDKLGIKYDKRLSKDNLLKLLEGNK